MTVSSLASLSIAKRPSSAKLEQARRAASRARRLQGERVSDRVIATLPALADILPGGGLAPGAAYSVIGSTALTAALVAEPTSRAMWVGVVGMPGFAAEGAAGLGCDLDRMVFVPSPGREWVNVVAALIDALNVVVVQPIGRVSDAEAARLSARLRQRESVLIACGQWPRADVRLSVGGSDWHGLGRGHGHLAARRAEVSVAARAFHAAKVAKLWLPDDRGDVLLDRSATLVDRNATEAEIEFDEAVG
jgi:hypothetical protein